MSIEHCNKCNCNIDTDKNVDHDADCEPIKEKILEILENQHKHSEPSECEHHLCGECFERTAEKLLKLIN